MKVDEKERMHTYPARGHGIQTTKKVSNSNRNISLFSLMNHAGRNGDFGDLESRFCGVVVWLFARSIVGGNEK